MALEVVPKLSCYRYQSRRADPEEKPEAWRYVGNESTHYEFPGEDRRSVCAGKGCFAVRHEVACLLARLWITLPGSEELRGGHQSI